MRRSPWRTACGAERTAGGAERTAGGAERTAGGAERTAGGAERTAGCRQADLLGGGEQLPGRLLETRDIGDRR